MNHLVKLAMGAVLLGAWAVPPAIAADAAPADSFHPYIGGFGGLTMLPAISGTDTFGAGSGKLNAQTGDIGGLVAGVALGDSWRFEGEVSRSYNGINNFTFNNGNVNTYQGGAVNQTYALANAWYGLNTNTAFKPYVGGGLGLGWVDGNLNLGSGNFVSVTAPAALALQVGGGITYDLSEHLSLDVGYRFKAMTGVSPVVTHNWPGNVTIDQSAIGSHTFQLGATWRF